jgi:tRNA modification GTPase
VSKRAPRHRVSAVTEEGLSGLKQGLIEHAAATLPRPGETALNRRQRGLIERARDALRSATGEHDLLLVAEGLREGRAAFDALVGRTATEDVLDALFGRFCIGK